MLNFLPAPLIGIIASLLLALNALFWVPILLCFAIVRLILPVKKVRLLIDPILITIAETWISGNSGWMKLTQRTGWDVEAGVADQCATAARQGQRLRANHRARPERIVEVPEGRIMIVC